MAVSSDIKCFLQKYFEAMERDREGKIPHEYSAIGNMVGIKTVSAWTTADRHDFTCFLLPAPVDQSPLALQRSFEMGLLDVTEGDFILLWHQLDDIHKERRLLMNYFCALRDGDYKGIERYKLLDDPMGVDALREGVYELISDTIWLMRRLFIEEQRNACTGGFVDTVNRFYAHRVHLYMSGKDKCCQHFFGRMLKKAYSNLNCRGPTTYERGGRRANMMASVVATCSGRIFMGFLALQVIWGGKSEPDRRRFLNQLRTAEVHWRQEDRRAVLSAIESNGRNCGTYVEKLIQAVGMDRFKLIALGKERFCSTCHRSSYVGEERLWTCQRCVDESVRPKARYCSVDCQRADWIKHKALAHTKRQE